MTAQRTDRPSAALTDRLSLSRRRFLGASAGSLVVTASIASGGRAATVARLAGLSGAAGANAAAAAGGTVTGWVTVGADESVTVTFGGAEMGQGTMSGLAQAVAEELMVDWSKVRTRPAPYAQSYITGGSSALRFGLGPMRLAGAQAREMLIAAAAARWNVAAGTCTATGGTVVNNATKQSFTYGQLAADAASMPVPASPPLVAQSAFRIIGNPVPRIDIPDKTNGSAIYGIDVRLPGMVFATVRHSPVIGGTLAATPAKPAGAIAVVPLGNAVAVVATNTWQAIQLVRGLNVRWNVPAALAANDDAAILATAKQLMTSGSPITGEQVGNADAAISGAHQVVQNTYQLPYLAHGYMEVLNATVSLTATSCDIWAPTQAPAWVAGTVAGLTGLPTSAITVHTTLLGGGLGRKIEQDYISQAVRVAMAVGRPVKLTWSREEDFSQDQYRPMALAQVRAGLDAAGNVTGWHSRIVTPSILGQRHWIGPGTVDSQAVEGAIELPYSFGARLVEWVQHPATIPVGFWRSVGNSINAFVVESMIDELAHVANVNPLLYRQRLLAGNARELTVLNAAAALGGWGTALPVGHARGIARHDSFGSVVAEVVEISQPAAGSIKVHKVAVVVDCGIAVNPDSVRAQMEGGVVHALSAALWGSVPFSKGQSTVRNFNHYRVLRMAEMPVVSVQIILSGQAIGGVGEVAVPPLAPALANAYFALTGTRVRALPFFPGATMGEAD